MLPAYALGGGEPGSAAIKVPAEINANTIQARSCEKLARPLRGGRGLVTVFHVCSILLSHDREGAVGLAPLQVAVEDYIRHLFTKPLFRKSHRMRANGSWR